MKYINNSFLTFSASVNRVLAVAVWSLMTSKILCAV